MSFRSLLIPTNENKFCPYLLKDWVLILYLILSVSVFIALSPFCEVKINKFLAEITQGLIIEQVNPVRVSYGFLELKPNDKLARAAQLKAEDMIVRDYFSHSGPNQETPWSWLDKVGYHYAAAGENLAIDINDPAILKNAWLASPSHAKNILNSYFTDIGIGIAKGEIENRESTVVVMFLGREFSSGLQGIVLEEDRSEELLAVPPEKPLVVKSIKEGELDQENLIIAGIESNIKPETKNIQLFLMSKLPKLFRILLSFFYGFLLVWLLLVVLKKEKISFSVSRSLILLMLLLSLWLPEIF